MLRAVIVEDDRSTRDLLGIIFSNPKWGVQVVAFAGDGVEGLETIRQHMPDFVVADQKMPRMTGIEMCIALRADAVLKHIPMFMLSAVVENTNQEAAMAAGFNGFFRKPFDINEFVTRLKQHLAAAS